ncbi:hypothetical protein [Ammoniphilus sp. CFH 90114]|uniref:hypothetical protein n=1 Tax=Ammoniphilus sp. CFH 90114 TaxID=2493665 RepID=UPI001F0BB161|nr:hypothetical protein [Ammoniphilus sp. CFH 90114]
MKTYASVIRTVQRLLKNLPDPTYMMDLNEQIFWGNKAFEKGLGHDFAAFNHRGVGRIVEKSL